MNSQDNKTLSLKKQLEKVKKENKIFKDNYNGFFEKMRKSAQENIDRHNDLYKRINGYTLKNNEMLMKIHRQMLKLENLNPIKQSCNLESHTELQQEIDGLVGKRQSLENQYRIFNQEFKRWNEEISDTNDKLNDRVNDLNKISYKRESTDQQSSGSSSFWKKLANFKIPNFNIKNEKEKTSLTNQLNPNSYHSIN